MPGNHDTYVRMNWESGLFHLEPYMLGDTYTIVAGCDKTAATCKARYANLVNFRGEPFIPGTDAILRVQR